MARKSAQKSAETIKGLKAEIRSLKSNLQRANRRISDLDRQLGRSQSIKLDKTETGLLSIIAECDMDHAFPVEFAKRVKLSPPRLDYHLQRLVTARCVDVLFEDPELGQNFGITQKGREILVKKHLL